MYYILALDLIILPSQIEGLARLVVLLRDYLWAEVLDRGGIRQLPQTLGTPKEHHLILLRHYRVPQAWGKLVPPLESVSPA